MNKRLLSGFVGLLLVLAVAGCVGAKPALAPQYDEGGVVVERVVEVEAEEPAMGVAEARDDENYATSDVAVERLVIRNASLDLVVRDTEEAIAEINKVVNDLGGFIVEMNVYQYEEAKSGSVLLRIPAENLDQALETFRGLATEVRSENVTGQDVTDQYVNLESRLRSKEATEAKLLEFLEEAEDTEAALAVYAQLERIQTDIEVLKGQIQYLEQSAAMSSVHISLTPDELAQPIEVGGWHPEGTLRDAVEALIRVLQFLVDALIVIVVVVLPVLLVIAAPIVGLIFLIRAIVRRRRARKTAD